MIQIQRDDGMILVYTNALTIMPMHDGFVVEMPGVNSGEYYKVTYESKLGSSPHDKFVEDFNNLRPRPIYTINAHWEGWPSEQYQRIKDRSV